MITFLSNLFKALDQKPISLDISSKGILNIAIHSGLGSRSHIKYIFEIATLLKERGHNITYVATDDALGYLKGYNLTGYSIGPKTLNDEDSKKLMKEFFDKSYNGHASEVMAMVLGYGIGGYYEKNFHKFKSYLLDHKPDLIVCDFFGVTCTDLAKDLGIPLIASFQATDFLGITNQPYITTKVDYFPIYTKDLTFYQKLDDFIDRIISMRYMIPAVNHINSIRKKFNILPSNEYFGDVNYGVKIANTFTGFEPAIPLDPNFIQVGPIISSSTQQLSPEIREFLDSHKRTMYIAFGSKIIIDSNIFNTLLESVILAIDQKIIDSVIWGIGRSKQSDFPTQINLQDGSIVDTDSFFNSKHKHIRLLHWAPQEAILNHPNTKVFISHGGLESTFEAIYSSTPILCLGLMGDQMRTASKIENMNVGLYVDKKTFTPQTLINQIQLIFEDKDQRFINGLTKMKTIASFNSKRVNLAADLMEQHAYTAMACRKYQPYDPKLNLPPCEVEHLLPKSYQMNFITANALDVYGFFIILILSLNILIFYIIVKVVQYIQKIQSKPQIKIKKM